MKNELIERVARALAQHDYPSCGFDGMHDVGQRGYRAKAHSVLAELAGELEDSRRIDALQEIFIKGEEFHIVMCEGKNEDEQCEHDTHPHFEAFDWSWRSSPVRASTLRGVIDKALTEGGEHE